MTGTEVNTPAWAERTLGVLLLPLAFVVMVGGGAGLVWLWRDYRSQLWIAAAVLVVAAALAHSGWAAGNRQKRRARWLTKRMGITPPLPSTGAAVSPAPPVPAAPTPDPPRA